MESLFQTLYSYVQENKVFRYLQTSEYRRAVSKVEEDWIRFRAMLTAEQEAYLDALLAQEEQVTLIEDEAAFCGALSIGIHLGRL